MAVFKALSSLRILCQECRYTYSIMTSPKYLHVYSGLCQTVLYQRCYSQASKAKNEDAVSETEVNKPSVEQQKLANTDKGLNLKKENEDESDLFGVLTKRKQSKKYSEKLSSSYSKDAKTKFSSSKQVYCNEEAAESWPSVFGTLAEDEDGASPDIHIEDRKFEDDEKDMEDPDKPYQRLEKYGRKHPRFWYGREIEELGKRGKVYEAIQVLEEQMLKQDRVLPNAYAFTALIGVVGRQGYTKKAFKLFNQMKKFGIIPVDHTYTALFNACSNSPWPEDGLRRANDLRQLMKEKEITPNMATYNAMIKTYAKYGDLVTAFSIVDEAINAGLKPDAYCYSSLLMACVSDKEAGLKHAIEVWRLLRKKKLTPNTYHYNLLLRVVRDCSTGDEEFLQQLIHHRQSQHSASLDSGQEKNNTLQKDSDSRKKEHKHHYEPEQSYPDLNNSNMSDDSVTIKSSSADALTTGTSLVRSTSSVAANMQTNVVCGVSVLDMDMPNLLNPRGNYVNLVHLEVPKSASERLALFGGVPGMLGHMTKDNAAPDIKTFTLLLDIVPSTRDTEADLLASMTLNKVKPDVDFCSLLIRKRNKRNDFEGAKDVLNLMDRLNLKPDIRTFGCLAMGCSQKLDAIQLFEEMQKVGLYPNREIFDILVYQSRWDFNYARHLLLEMKSFKVQPNENLIKKFEMKVSQARDLIVKMESGEDVPSFCRTNNFAENFRKFMLLYKSWLLSTSLEENVHPWAKFVQPTPVVPADDTDESNVVEAQKKLNAEEAQKKLNKKTKKEDRRKKQKELKLN